MVANIHNAQEKKRQLIYALADLRRHFAKSEALETEHKRARESYKRLQEDCSKIIDAAPLWIWASNSEGTEIYLASAGAKMLTGHEPKEFINIPSLWFDLIPKEDRGVAMEANVRARRNKVPTSYECRITHKEGSHRWMQVTIIPELDKSGQVVDVFGFAVDITERKQAEEELRQSKLEVQTANQELRALSRRLLQVQETERRKLALELHDELGQLLTIAKLNLQRIGRLADADRLKDSIALLDRLLEQVRHLSLSLHPPLLDQLGLIAALQSYVDQQSQCAGLEAQFVADPLAIRLEEVTESTCFRVAQEAVTNVLRHAEAKKMTVELAKEGEVLHLVVRDDGVGFDSVAALAGSVEGQSFGLMGMEERMDLLGGRFECLSAPGKGTEVHAYFPLTQPSDDVGAEDW